VRALASECATLAAPQAHTERQRQQQQQQQGQSQGGAAGGASATAAQGMHTAPMSSAAAPAPAPAIRPITLFARKGTDCLGKYAGDAELHLRLLFEMVREACRACGLGLAQHAVHGMRD
jgi:hypothetical protein